MNWSTGMSWLAALKPQRSAERDEDDRAGMGTAFGLDASLTRWDEPAPASASASATVQAAAAPVAWEQPLTRRSRL